MNILTVAIVVMMLAGCASDYNKYAEMQTNIQVAKSNAEAAKYQAISAIAQNGDTTAKVAAMFSLQGIGQGQQAVHIAAPKSASDNIREWMGILIPSLIQGYGIHANQRIAVTQSNNSRDVAVSTNSAFVGMAGQIQAPAANVTASTATTTTDNSISNSYNPIDNSNQGNPVDNANNSNQSNPVTNQAAVVP